MFDWSPDFTKTALWALVILIVVRSMVRNLNRPRRESRVNETYSGGDSSCDDSGGGDGGSCD